MALLFHEEEVLASPRLDFWTESTGQGIQNEKWPQLERELKRIPQEHLGGIAGVGQSKVTAYLQEELGICVGMDPCLASRGSES